ncbi:hypothetical protein PBV52_29310 [Streptomyces sp. T12]|uniref:hypothetical protein n=1 Tax=Streptomyces sp. T12 TaxID=477697 RepID=UPI0023670BD6|nr:hypothetical protein [Streptomyces sp. T12]WDF40586.1 hypothetical protein PBV52_29310 [Streptomyces sp. T12]
MSSTLKRAAVPALAAGLLVTSFATPAAAQTPGSTAFHIFGNAILSARAGAVNDVTATVVNGRLRLTDTSGIAAGPGCLPVSATTVECGSLANTVRLSIGLGDLSDRFRGQGLAVRTVVDAGAGSDIVRTGSANDTIGVRDGVAGNDTVSCDGGSDIVQRDVGDIIAADCESRF